jgi:hypothetical protein
MLLNVIGPTLRPSSTRKRACSLLQLVAVGTLPLGISGAFAQTGGAPTVGPTPRIERTEDRTISERDAYLPLGVKVGSFQLFPTLEADEIFNDNIYATSAATGRTASFVQLLKPSLDLRSQWSVHELNLFARGGFGFYSADASQNFQDFSVGATGRLDIQRDWNVYGGASFNRAHEALGTPNTISGAGFQPSVYNQTSANVGYYQAFRALNIRLDGRMDNYSYLNNGQGPAQGFIQNTDRNRTEFRETLRVGHEFSPGYQIWARGGLNQRTYANVPDSSGSNRNSNGWEVLGGITIDFGGITSLEAFGGYLQQNYVSGQFSTISAPTFGLTGYWNPIRELWVKPFVRRTVDDSSLSNSASYLNTAFGLDVTYDARPNIRVEGHGDYSIADYSAVSFGNSQYDQYYTLRVGVLYQPTRNFFVGPQYQFIHRTSNQFNNDYDQNVVMLRLGAQL